MPDHDSALPDNVMNALRRYADKHGLPPRLLNEGDEDDADIVVKRYKNIFSEVRITSKTCNCLIHCGDLLTQIDAKLVNGTPIRILFDMYGIHASVGVIGEHAPSVTESELERMIQEALR